MYFNASFFLLRNNTTKARLRPVWRSSTSLSEKSLVFASTECQFHSYMFFSMTWAQLQLAMPHIAKATNANHAYVGQILELNIGVLQKKHQNNRGHCFASCDPNCWLSSQLLNFNPSHNLLGAPQEQLLPQFRTNLEITMEPAPLANDRSRLPRTQLSLSTRALPQGTATTPQITATTLHRGNCTSALRTLTEAVRGSSCQAAKPRLDAARKAKKLTSNEEGALAKMAMPGAVSSSMWFCIFHFCYHNLSQNLRTAWQVYAQACHQSALGPHARDFFLFLLVFLLPSCLSTCNDIESCPNLALHTTDPRGPCAPQRRGNPLKWDF